MTALQVSIEKLIKPFEGCKLKAYPDPATGGDPWTIGWGATGEQIHSGVTWTQAQADNRLILDASRFERGVKQQLKVALTVNQLAALISFSYNVGLGNFGKSTLLKCLNDGDIKGASLQFLRWNRANGKVMAGLTRRRLAEQAIFNG